MKSILKFWSALVLFFPVVGWFAGCASTTYEVKLDVISRPASPASHLASYSIQNKNPAVETDSLRYKEAVQRVRTALSGLGLWEAPDKVTPDMVVELDYGTEQARTVYKDTSVPIYLPACPVVGQMTGRRLWGYENVATPEVVYEKHLSISCRENKPGVEGRPVQELWRISASIEDANANLRECLPVLATVVMEQVGKTSNGVVTMRVEENDRAVAFVKKGI